MEEIKFRHTLPIQLRFNDVDKFGHVNNTVYFSFYDLGKTEYFASVCPGVDWEKDGIGRFARKSRFLRTGCSLMLFSRQRIKRWIRVIFSFSILFLNAFADPNLPDRCQQNFGMC